MACLDLLAHLEPIQQQIVSLVYFEGRSEADTARILAVDRVEVGAALAVAFRRIAGWVLDEGAEVRSFRAITTRVRPHAPCGRALGVTG